MRTFLAAASLLFAVSSLANTITVTGSGDTVGADGACTLREAIIAANTNSAVNECGAGAAGSDTIAFNIGGGGPQIINVASDLPQITEAVTIDGSTQPGFGIVPLIRIIGTPALNALFVTGTANGTNIYSLAIGNFNTALTLQAANCFIRGNLIGLDWIGNTAIPNQTGIRISATSPAMTAGDAPVAVE